jgi:hypothetical protein
MTDRSGPNRVGRFQSSGLMEVYTYESVRGIIIRRVLGLWTGIALMMLAAMHGCLDIGWERKEESAGRQGDSGDRPGVTVSPLPSWKRAFGGEGDDDRLLVGGQPLKELT